MDRLKKFFLNGFLMTCVALAARYVSVGFNIYLSNKIGAAAMGLFTLISSVYGFALTVATSGISLATTKLVSSAIGNGEARADYNTLSTINAIMKKSILFSLTVSIAAGAVLFFSAEAIGTKILFDVRTVRSLKILAISLPPIALSASLSGYFVSVRKVYKNAFVQIISQAARIYLCVRLLASTLASDTESACVAVVTAICTSEMLCCATHGILFAFEQRKNKYGRKNTAPDKGLSSRLLPITIPVALSAYTRSALVTVEHLLIPWGLERSGINRDSSLSAYGTLHSIIFPLLLFPAAISSSFASLLVPEISESDAAGDRGRIERIVCRVLKTVLIYSIGTACVIMCLSGEIARVLVPKTDSALFIILLAPLIPIMYLDTSVDSILKGLGYQFYSMIINIIDSSASVILVIILLPRFGIIGYVMTVYFTELLNAALSITKLLTVTKPRVKIFDWVIKPLTSAICASAVGRAVLSSLHSCAQSRYDIFLQVLLISSLYILTLIILRAISPQKIKRSVLGFIKG